MPRGAVITRDGKYDVTTYSCCVNALTGVYYFKTYKDSRINAAAMHSVKSEEDRLHIYPLESGQYIRKLN